MTGEESAALIVSLYEGEADARVKHAAVEALFMSGSAGPLVELARKEKDPAMKKLMVERLSHMDSKEATDFLLEILGK